MSSKSKLAIYNTSASIGYEIVSVIAGLILPRFILVAYGSDVNGLLSSISQFLSFITFCEAGVGAVVKSNLYKPLADKNNYNLSCVLKSSEKYFRLIALLLCIYTFALMIIFPLVTKDFSWVYISTLILIISSSLFSQYYFGITNRLLLYADHRAYVPLLLTIISVILNTIISIIVIEAGGGIHLVKLTSSVIFFCQPICLYLYVKKHYSINNDVKYEGEPLKQKWNGFAQHIATISQDNAGIIILTLFSNLANVSIYAIYILVVNGLKQLINSVNASMSPIIGELIAKKEDIRLSAIFRHFEWVMHNISVFLFSIAGVLIVPFVLIYTKGVNDANYNVPIFAYCITLAVCIRCLQICYNIVIQSACHFKQTQLSSIIEIIINLTISIALVFKFGLIGVALGLIVSLTYRLSYFCWYLKRNIIYRKYSIFFKQLLVDFILAISIIFVAKLILKPIVSYLDWTLYALIITLISLILLIIINLIFYPNEIKSILKRDVK